MHLTWTFVIASSVLVRVQCGDIGMDGSSNDSLDKTTLYREIGATTSSSDHSTRAKDIIKQLMNKTENTGEVEFRQTLLDHAVEQEVLDEWVRILSDQISDRNCLVTMNRVQDLVRLGASEKSFYHFLERLDQIIDAPKLEKSHYFGLRCGFLLSLPSVSYLKPGSLKSSTEILLQQDEICRSKMTEIIVTDLKHGRFDRFVRNMDKVKENNFPVYLDQVLCALASVGYANPVIFYRYFFNGEIDMKDAACDGLNFLTVAAVSRNWEFVKQVVRYLPKIPFSGTISHEIIRQCSDEAMDSEILLRLYVSRPIEFVMMYLSKHSKSCPKLYSKVLDAFFPLPLHWNLQKVATNEYLWDEMSAVCLNQSEEDEVRFMDCVAQL